MKLLAFPLLLLGAWLHLSAAETPAPPGTPPVRAASPVKKLPSIKYTPPPTTQDNIGQRISGGTRAGTASGVGKLPQLEVLTPDHIALTSQAQPTLFWYQSAPAKVGFQLTLTEPDRAKPLIDVDLDTAENAGIRALSLRRQNVSLELGVTYRWSVALIPDKANRSKDTVASGKIKRVPVPKGLEEKLTGATPAERASLYAAAGLWYDAFQSISVAIAAEPANADLRQRRATLLKEVGLEAVAAADRR